MCIRDRKVGVASPSEATFNTYVQLDKEDVDMMDYQLFAISEDDDGELIIDPVTMSDDPDVYKRQGIRILFTMWMKKGKWYRTHGYMQMQEVLP